MPMTTTVTVAYEGPPACRDCQRGGVPLCAHIGFNPEAWDGLLGCRVHVPGLDPAFDHIAQGVEISSDRKTVTVTVETQRPPMTDLARHLSTLGGPKARIRAQHVDSGVLLADGHYDAPLSVGQQVYINGTPHLVSAVEHPNRDPDTGVATGEDLQLAHLQEIPQPDPVTPLGGREGTT